MTEHAYTKPPPADPWERDNPVGRRALSDEARSVGMSLPFTTARDSDGEVTDEVDISFVFPYAISGYVIMITGKDDDRNIMLYAPKDGPWADRDAAAAWAAKHIYTKSNHWVVVPLSQAMAPAAIAVAFLEQAGMKIAARDWSCPQGSLEIIAIDGRTLVAVAISNDGELPRPAKRNRMRRTALQWFVAQGLLFDELRVDVIFTHYDGGTRQLVVDRHAKGVG
jgi:putative endonuclease